jgi:hypothetical protein
MTTTVTRKALLGAALALVAAAPVGRASAAPPPDRAGCVAQFVADFRTLNPGYTVGDVQGHLGVEFANYPFGPGGQAHYAQPFGVLLQGQATSPHDDCLFDLTP